MQASLLLPALGRQKGRAFDKEPIRHGNANQRGPAGPLASMQGPIEGLAASLGASARFSQLLRIPMGLQ